MLKVYAVEQWYGDSWEGSWGLLLVTTDAEEVERYRYSSDHNITEWEVKNEQADS